MFYTNLRDELEETKGSLYSLKKEFDSLPDEEIKYLKQTGAVPVLKRFILL